MSLINRLLTPVLLTFESGIFFTMRATLILYDFSSSHPKLEQPDVLRGPNRPATEPLDLVGYQEKKRDYSQASVPIFWQRLLRDLVELTLERSLGSGMDSDVRSSFQLSFS